MTSTHGARTGLLALSLFSILLAIPFVTAALTADDYVLHVANSTGNNTTTWFDFSGNGRNATIEGNPTFAAYQGYGFNTTNNNASIRVYRPFGGEWQIGGQNQSWSVYGWFRPSNGATNWGTVWATSFNSYDNRSTCQMNVASTGVFGCGLYNGSAYVGDKTCLISNDGLPHSFVYTWNRTTNTSQLYCDNVLSSTTGGGALHTGTAQRTYFGQRTDTAEPLNGTLFWIGAHQRVLTLAEISEVYNYGFNYLNATPPVANNYVNITISAVKSRDLQPNFKGLDTHEVAGFPFYESSNGSLRNNTLDQEIINSFDPNGIRTIISLQNVCASGYTGNPTNPCSFSTTNTSSYANINLVRSLVGNQTAQGRKIYFNQDGMPRWLADNSSKCDYGYTNGVNWFNYTKCDPSNFTIYANAVAQYMEAIGCTTTYKNMCVLEGWNEPYLSSNGGSTAAVGIFYYSNRTVDCAQRTAGQMALWNKTFPIYSARLGSNVEYLSPSFNYGYSSCGVSMANTFMAQHPYGGNASPDFMNTHEYSSSNPPALTTDLASAQSGFSAGGWGTKWKITEGNLNNDALNTNSPEVTAAALMTSMIYLIQNTTAQGWVLYDYDTDETYSTYNYPNRLTTPNFLKPTGLMLNATKYFDDTSSQVYNCTVSTDVDVSCIYVLKNASQGFLFISNYQNSTTLVDRVTITGSNATGAVSNTNGTTYAGGSAQIQNIVLGKYGFDGYNVTLQGADVTPPTLTNRSEYANQTLLQINITCDEACNASINFGTDFTTLGNKSNITAYSTTVQGFNLTPMRPNTLYHYNVTVCDATGNCATYGIYSEATTARAISFNGVNPVSTTPSINEPNNLTFGFNLTNPDTLNFTVSWTLNGSNIPACDNLQTCVFTGNSTSAGIYIYNVTVTPSALKPTTNLSYQWTLTVNDTDTTPPVITVVSPVSATYTTNTILISFTATDSENNISSRWFYNGTANVTYTAPVNITLPDNTYLLGFYANDTRGNVGSATVLFVVNTAPATCTDLGNRYGILMRIFLILTVVFIGFAMMKLFGDMDAGTESIALVVGIITALVIASVTILPLVTNYCLT